MIKLCLGIAIVFVFISQFGCKDSSTNGSNVQNNVDLSRVKNRQWKLTSAQYGDSLLPLDTYRPFYFSMDDTTVRGDDGCNGFEGSYHVHGDTLSIPGLGGTLIACYYTYFDYDSLSGSWIVSIPDTSKFNLRRNEKTLGFTVTSR